MKLIRLILIVAFAGTTLAIADLPKYRLRNFILVDATEAVGALPDLIEDTMSDADIEKRELVIREVEPLFNLNPDSWAEFVALGRSESKESPISAVELQEAIIDYESQTVGKTVPTLIAFYISKSKVGGLRPQQRVVCYVMLKSLMRQINATKAKQ